MTLSEKEGESYWCLMDCKSGNPYYFHSESEYKNHANKLKLKDFAIALENG